MSGPQGNANSIGQPQGAAQKIVAWSGVLEWQEVTRINKIFKRMSIHKEITNSLKAKL